MLSKQSLYCFTALYIFYLKNRIQIIKYIIGQFIMAIMLFVMLYG